MQSHRSSIDVQMAGVKGELELLRQFDALGCSVDDYVKQLQAALATKMRGMRLLSDQLDTFSAHLKEEEQMSKAVQRTQTR